MPATIENTRVVASLTEAAATASAAATTSTLPRPYPSPADWRDHWIYFLLVDRFNNPMRPPQPAGFPCGVYQGGNFAGIKAQLPYLNELGAGAIWLSPVLKNPQWFSSYWGGYGIFNFLEIEPRFCSNPAAAKADPSLADEEFQSLVDAAHSIGIYVILDIVLNHVGNLFNYEGAQDEREWNADGEYRIFWRDEHGAAHGHWTNIEQVPNLAREQGVWPKAFQQNHYFRRRGNSNGELTKGDFPGGLKELVTEHAEVRMNLIQVYQYLIARFDIDGYRIDTLQYVEPHVARIFGNAMREYALSVGKKNFFTFGEVWQDDDESKIAEFVGRNTVADGQEFIGIDAAIDFPVRKRLWCVAKGFVPPASLAAHLDYRRQTLKTVVSSHDDAGGHYVTFLGNHDLEERFHNPAFFNQTKFALACLLTLQGIPCVYYGEEQGLEGNGDRREYAREALWGRQNAFSTQHGLFQHIKALSALRGQEPALRYGRQYFRECSGDGVHFGYSPYNGGLLSFSRILNDREILVAGNANTTQSTTVHVVVDANLNPEGKTWQVLFSSEDSHPAIVSTTHGAYRTVQLTLAPMEVLVLA